MARIPLSGKLGSGKFAIVDDDDVFKVAGRKWHLTDNGYVANRTQGETLRMHRLINDTPDGMFTDHKNHDRLDNRKSNLRTVSQKENMSNSIGLGITWDETRQAWIVRYKGKFYGRYQDKEQALREYQLARSGKEHVPQKRKLYFLPTGITKQFGKYRVRPQKNGKRYWLGQFVTLEEAQKKLKEWQNGG